MKVIVCTVTGTLTAKRMAEALIDCSKWFSMTPLPDDEYEFTAKDESGLPTGFIGFAAQFLEWRSTNDD